MSLQLADLFLKEDPSRPVQSCLSRLCLENVNAALSALNDVGALLPPRTTPSAEVERVLQQLRNDTIQYLNNSEELMDWVYPPSRPLSLAEALRKAKEFTELVRLG